jgi:hypothetical protein
MRIASREELTKESEQGIQQQQQQEEASRADKKESKKQKKGMKDYSACHFFPRTSETFTSEEQSKVVCTTCYSAILCQLHG